MPQLRRAMVAPINEFFANVFETCDVPLAVIDPSLRVVHANAAFLARCHGPTSELSVANSEGQVPSLDVLLHPQARVALERAVTSVLESGAAVDALPVALARAFDSAATDQTPCLVAKLWPIRLGEQIQAVAVRLQETPANAATLEALRRSEMQFRAICEASPVGIFLTDPEGGNLYANPTHLAQLGLKGGGTRALNWAHVLTPSEKAVSGEIEQPGTVFQGVSHLEHDDGRRVTIQVRITKVTDGDTVVGYLGMCEDITVRVNAEAERRESDLRFRQLAENIGSTFWLASADRAELYYVSPAFEQIWGRRTEDIVRNPQVFVSSIHADDRERVLSRLASSPNEAYEIEYRIVRPDGTIAWIHDRGFPVRDEGGQVVRVAGIATDVTAHKGLEARLLQSQKLDSIGRLAGGISHDFNNLLTVILNQVTMAQRLAERGEVAADELLLIDDAAKQAAEVTRQLLSFARQQTSTPSLVDLNELAESVARFLRRVIGEQIELRVDVEPDIGVLRIDRGQLEQIMVNLSLNARDAMPGGGKLTFETRNVELRAPRAGTDSVPPGSWVLLRVTDTGTGIPNADQSLIFEPFFTTKEPGAGTGLGLATCWGLVKQHGGFVLLDSELGRGTTFELYFPRIDSPPEPKPPSRTPLPKHPGRGVVLVVEDEPSVRALAARALRADGFDVLEASHGAEAIAQLERDAKIDVIVSDVVMPGIGGAELAAHVREHFPNVHLVLTSGYPSESLWIQQNTQFLPKPYAVEDLLKVVRDALQ